MAKQWTYKDDVFLVRYIEMGADFIASHDLGFADGAGTKRVKILKESGVFENIEQAIKAELLAQGLHTLRFSRSEEAKYVWSKTLEEIGYYQQERPIGGMKNEPTNKMGRGEAI